MGSRGLLEHTYGVRGRPDTLYVRQRLTQVEVFATRRLFREYQRNEAHRDRLSREIAFGNLTGAERQNLQRKREALSRSIAWFDRIDATRNH